MLGLPHVCPKRRLLVPLICEGVAGILTVFIGLLRELGGDGATSDFKAILLIVVVIFSLHFRVIGLSVPGFLISVGLALMLLGLLITIVVLESAL
uniref:Uncharacterized protein n=1 Tax=Glossina palpalis gambiensis TaxID=67801 RepID=A0A1B0C388_9MUSC